MKRIIYVIFTIAFVSIQSNASAQKYPGATFTGKINYADRPDSLVVFTYHSNWYYTNYSHQKIAVNRNGRFKFILPASRGYLYFTISNMRNGKTYHDPSKAFFALANDRIAINFYQNKTGSDSLVFSGRGSDKYNLSAGLRYQYDDFNQLRSQIKLIGSSNIEAELMKLRSLVDKYEGLKVKTLENATRINEETKHLIAYNYGQYNETWNELISNYFTGKSLTTEQKKMVMENYKKFRVQEFPQPSIVAVNSPFYMMSLVEKIKLDLLIQSDSSKIRFPDLYNTVINNYDGAIRERLLAELFRSKYTLDKVAQFDPVEYDNLVEDARKYLKKSEILNEALDYKQLYQKGQSVEEAKFVYENDSIFSLSHLKGKVVLMDMWGTGCTGCISFHSRLKKYIKPKFIGNPQFAILSVNTDKTKAEWMKSLASEQYSTAAAVNVYTGGKNFDHPFIHHYRVSAYPFILLIDKQGKIYSKIGIDISMDVLSNLISSAIADK